MMIINITNRTYKSIMIAVAFWMIIVSGILIFNNTNTAEAAEYSIATTRISTQMTDNAKQKYAAFDGYKNVNNWYKKFKKIRKAKINNIKKHIRVYGSFMTEKELNKMNWYKEKLKQVHTIKRLKQVKMKANIITKRAAERKRAYDEEQAYLASFDGKSNHVETITAWGGVYYYYGRRETYYSSNVLYHYMTPQWICDEEGFWRTQEGYYVVACDDYPYGSIYEGSKGLCMVLDCGCGSTTDYYVCW